MISSPSQRSAAARWLTAGFLMTFSSAFGQTFYISVFADDLKAAFDLGDGAFGAYYTAATLTSSGLLVYAGRIADRDRLTAPALGVLLGLAVTALAMAWSTAGWMLLPIFLGLRFFGQGMLGHIALTAMARWFEAGRGRAIAVAAMGNPGSQAVLPITAVVLSGVIGWRATWLLAAAALVVVAIPLVWLLLRDEPGRAPVDRGEGAGSARSAASPGPGQTRHQWTRAEVMRDPLFYMLMPGILAPAFVITGIFFNQTVLMQAKGWDKAMFAGWFAANAGTAIAATFLTGWAIDRFGSARVMPLFLLPLVAGSAALGLSDDPLAVPVFMVGAGIALGCASTLLGAVWADLYGTRHLGSIRSLASAGGVFASALAPGLMGVLLDLGVAIDHQIVGMAVYTACSAVLLVAAQPRLRRGVAGVVGPAAAPGGGR